jgi:hypothetical protein
VRERGRSASVRVAVGAIQPETTAPLTRETPGKSLLSRLVGGTRRSLDLCRPAAISGAVAAISRLTLATRRSLSFARAAVSVESGVVDEKDVESTARVKCCEKRRSRRSALGDCVEPLQEWMVAIRNRQELTDFLFLLDGVINPT